MKEITRIHLAKVAYDIEIDAKKDIEKYIKELERYAGDSDLMSDIEIRITELLAERGVLGGGVIASDDVRAVRERLGEPKDFAPEGTAGEVELDATDEPRRVYRDVENEWVGGVLAGFARFFGIDALWLRLIFIVLMFASFGVVTIVYAILWVIIPPALTAADKLRMSGKPVTLASIKKLGEQAEPVANRTATIFGKVLRTGVGVIMVINAVVAFAITVIIGFGLLFGMGDNSPIADFHLQESWWVGLAVGLFMLAGFMLSALFSLLANVLFRSSWSKQAGVTIIVVIVAGLFTFASGIGVLAVGSISEQNATYNLRKTSSVNLPGNFKNISTLTIKSGDDASNTQIEYIVSDKARWEMDALPCSVKPQFAIADDSQSATLTINSADCDSHKSNWSYRMEPLIRVYGPALEKLSSEQNTNVEYTNSQKQKAMTVVSTSATVRVHGTYESMELNASDSGSVVLEDAAIENLKIDNKNSTVRAGVVRSLAVTQPDYCPAYDAVDEDESQILIHVQAVSSGKLIYNGEEKIAKNIDGTCGKVIIGDEEEN